jgi:hypothetical protein
MSLKFTVPSSVPCRKYAYIYPIFTPQILGLSIYTSVAGVYTQVTISGNNFSYGSNIGYSVVNFGQYQNIPVVFYGSSNISFIIPTLALPGTYNVQVVNLWSPTSTYSNILTYTLT